MGSCPYSSPRTAKSLSRLTSSTIAWLSPLARCKRSTGPASASPRWSASSSSRRGGQEASRAAHTLERYLIWLRIRGRVWYSVRHDGQTVPVTRRRIGSLILWVLKRWRVRRWWELKALEQTCLSLLSCYHPNSRSSAIAIDDGLELEKVLLEVGIGIL